MERLPNDPMILFSTVNMLLRDNYQSLDELCDDMHVKRQDIQCKEQQVLVNLACRKGTKAHRGEDATQHLRPDCHFLHLSMALYRCALVPARILLCLGRIALSLQKMPGHYYQSTFVCRKFQELLLTVLS